jgi:hypothetical protein
VYSAVCTQGEVCLLLLGSMLRKHLAWGMGAPGLTAVMHTCIDCRGRDCCAAGSHADSLLPSGCCRASQDAGSITIICPGTCVQQVWHCGHAAAGTAAAAAAGGGGATTTLTTTSGSSSSSGGVANGTPAAAGAAVTGRPQRSAAAVMPPLLSISFPAAPQQRLSTPFGGPSKAPFEWAPTAGPLEPASEMDGAAVDQATSSAAAVARSGVPGVMETKQHGGSSAFLALTAIDSIREESASEWGSSSHGTPPVSAWASPGADGASSSQVEASGHASANRSSSGDVPAAAAPAASTQQRSGSGAPSIKTLFWTMKESGSGSGGLYSNSSPHKPVEPITNGDRLPCALAVPAAAALGSPAGTASQAAAASGLAPSAGATSSSVTAGSALVAGQGSGSDSHAAAAGPSVRGGSKHVRFAVERAAGATASRDRSLIYTAPEILHGQR